MRRQIEGSRAVAEAVALCRPEVICAYPISPQTHIVEGLGELVKDGTLTPCEFINVESEFAAISGLISLDAVMHAISARFAGAVGEGNVAAARAAHAWVADEMWELADAAPA